MAAAALLFLLVGCGGDGRLPRFPASGRVLVDGRPMSGVQVRLHPVSRLGDVDALRPFGVTDEDGAFRLGTYEARDGAPAGRYKVTLFWADRPPGPSPPKDRLGGRFDKPGRSLFEVTIAEGENTLGPFRAESTTATRRNSRPRPNRPDLDGLGSVPLP